MKRNAAKTLTLAAVAATMMLTGTACGSGQQQGMQMPAPQIAVMDVEYSNSELERAYPATIKGRTDIDIRPQVTGFITKVHVDEGQQVRKGQPLFTLDQVQYQAAVDAARQAVAVAESAVSTAQLTANNKRKLFDKNIISEYEWQMADNNLASAKAQLASAKAQLVSAQKNLAFTVVTSPSDGVVGTIPNREGSLASPSSAQPLTTVSDNSQVYAYFSLNEKDIIELTKDGSQSLSKSIAEMPEVSLRMANGQTFPEKGKVATVSGVIDNTTGAASVRALFNNKGGMLRSGSTGSVIIPVQVENAIIIPQKASYELQDRRFVYVIDADNKAVSRPIEVSPVTDGQNFVVVSGLQPGDRIAVEGVGVKVKDGVQIQPVDASAQAAQAAAQQPAAQQPAAE